MVSCCRRRQLIWEFCGLLKGTSAGQMVAEEGGNAPFAKLYPVVMSDMWNLGLEMAIKLE